MAEGDNETKLKVYNEDFSVHFNDFLTFGRKTRSVFKVLKGAFSLHSDAIEKKANLNKNYVGTAEIVIRPLKLHLKICWEIAVQENKRIEWDVDVKTENELSKAVCRYLTVCRPVLLQWILSSVFCLMDEYDYLEEKDSNGRSLAVAIKLKFFDHLEFSDHKKCENNLMVPKLYDPFFDPKTTFVARFGNFPQTEYEQAVDMIMNCNAYEPYLGKICGKCGKQE